MDTPPAHDLNACAIDPWALLDTLTDCLVLLDTTGMICYRNVAWQQLQAYGLTIESEFTIGRSYMADYKSTFLPSPAEAGILETGLREVLAGTRTHFICEAMYITAGRQRWLAISMFSYSVQETPVVLVLQRDITDHKEIEAMLREMKQRFELALQASNNGIWDWDIVTNEVFFSPGWKKMLGFADHEIANHFDEWVDRLHPDDHERAMATVQACLDGHLSVYELEHRLRHKDGTYRWMRTCATLLRDIAGTAHRMVGSQTDITAAKSAEAALRRRDAILEAVSFAAEQFLQSASWEDDMQLVLERLGSATAVSRIYVFENYTAEDGRPLTRQRYEWSAVGIPPQIDNPDFQQLSYAEAGIGRWVDVLGCGEVIYGQTQDFPASEQEILTVQDITSIVVVPIMVGSTWWGTIGFDQCFITHMWTPTEVDTLRAAANIIGSAIQRSAAEEAIRQNEVTYRTVLNAIPDLKFQFSRDGIFLDFQGERDALQIPPETFLDKSVTEVLPPELAQQVLELIEQTLATHAIQTFEYQMLMEPGLQDFEGRFVVISPDSVLLLARDITERKQAEEALRQRVIQDEIIRGQEATLAELSTPLLPIGKSVVLMPLVGTVDSRRAQQVMDAMVHGVAQHRARVVILDITGVPVVDTQVADALIRAARAVRLLGAKVLLTGISPEIAQTLVGLGVVLSDQDIRTHNSLQSGVVYALQQGQK